MIRLLCNGVNLDLKDSQTITLSRVNPLFAFDNLSCERSTEFSLPDTPTNNKAFELSKCIATRGVAMRKRYKAQMVDGVCTKDGYLYVSEYDGEYKAIFVTGELLGLQRIKDAGKLSDFVTTERAVIGTYPLPSNDEKMFNRVYYHTDDKILPSWRVSKMLDNVSRKLNVKISHVSASNGLRVIPNKAKKLQGYNHRFISKKHNGPLPSYNEIYNDHIGIFDLSYYITIKYWHNEATPIGNGYYTESTVYDGEVKFQSYKVNDDISITFNDDFPSNFFIYTEKKGIIRNLAGKSIQLIPNERFNFFADGDFNEEQTGGPYYEQDGVPFYTYQYTIPMSGSNGAYDFYAIVDTVDPDNLNVGSNVYLKDNLPDMTVIDLLKTVANIRGNVLNYTDADGVTFDDLNYQGWPVIDLTSKLISIGNVKRTFGDYAAKNSIVFKSWDTTPEAQRLTEEYTIDNTNIKQSNQLAEIPFSEGERYADDPSLVYVNAEPGDSHTIAVVGSGYYLERVKLTKNPNIQRLCDSSTSVKAKVLMSHFEYEQVKAKTIILIQSIKYVWTESQYSDGVAVFILSRC